MNAFLNAKILHDFSNMYKHFYMVAVLKWGLVIAIQFFLINALTAQTGITVTGTVDANTLSVTSITNVSNMSFTGTIEGGTFSGTLSAGTSNAITSVGTLSALTVTNNITAGTISGTLTAAAQPNITSLGGLSSITVSGNITAGTLSGTITTAGQPQITTVGTLNGLTVSGTLAIPSPFNLSGTSVTVTGTEMNQLTGVTSNIQTQLDRIKIVSLSSDATANATTTLATISGLTTAVGVGTYVFQYFIRYQSSVTTTGVDFAINHTGTVTNFLANWRYASTGGAAATAAASQAISAATGNIHESYSIRTLNTKMGPTVSVDIINADMLAIIEGILIVTASGSLEFKHNSETAASTQVMAGSSLILTKVN